MDFRNITNIINEYTEQTFGLVADCSLDFAFYPDAGEDEPDITYSLLVTEKTDKTFKKFVKIAFNCDFDNIFVLSLLHEVGHAMTDEDWTARQQDDFANRKNGLSPDNEIDLYTYYYIPDEYNATKWAIEYIQEHPQEIEKFWNRVQTQIENFYKENEYEI